MGSTRECPRGVRQCATVEVLATARNVMVQESGFRALLPGRIGTLAVAVLVTALVVFATCLMVWYHLGGGAWLSGVDVVDARLKSPDRLLLLVASCHGAPRVSLLRETDVDVQVKVIAFSTPLHGGRDCLDRVELRLGGPLGDRAVVDRHSGQWVDVAKSSE